MTTTSRAVTGFAATSVGGPTLLIELGGMRLLTDPTFDPPGQFPVGARVLTKLVGPAITEADLGPIDAVLLSHDQHPDNLDTTGRAFLTTVPTVLSTPSAASRLPGITGGRAWDHHDLRRPDGSLLQVMWTPAEHGPDGTEHLTGEVTGFLLSGPGLPMVYVSGDNASLPIVSSVASRSRTVDVAVLFTGAARTALLGDAYLTLTSTQSVDAVRILDAPVAIPIHWHGWGHYTEGADELREAFTAAGLADRLVLLEPGRTWPELIAQGAAGV